MKVSEIWTVATSICFSKHFYLNKGIHIIPVTKLNVALDNRTVLNMPIFHEWCTRPCPVRTIIHSLDENGLPFLISITQCEFSLLLLCFWFIIAKQPKG